MRPELTAGEEAEELEIEVGVTGFGVPGRSSWVTSSPTASDSASGSVPGTSRRGRPGSA